LVDQSRRQPLQRQINEAAVARAAEKLSAKSLGLPCKITAVNDQTVTVQITVRGLTFPPLPVPIAEPLYSRAPYQVGDRGVVVSIDAGLEEASGASTILPLLNGTGNLGALFFLPISNDKWAANPDQTMYLLQGLNGFLIRSLDGAVYIRGDKRTALTLGWGTNSITINAAGISMTGVAGGIQLTSGGVNVTGTFFVNGHPYLAHEHSGVQTGGGDTGGIVPGT